MTEIDFVDQSFVNFRDHTFSVDGGHGYRWVNLKSFRIPRAAQDTDLLAAVIAHEQFRDDYAGGDVDAHGTRHGPYWLREVGLDVYRPIGTDACLRVLRRWAGQHGGLPDTLQDALDSALFSVVASATRLYGLRDLGSSAFHDWGGVHIDFHEFIAIDDADLLLTLLVAADD